MTQPAGESGAVSLPPRRRRWVSWLLAIVIFFAGAAVGSGLAVVIVVRKVQYAIQHPEAARARLVSHLQRRLGLNAAQTSQVQQIMTRRQRALQEIRRDVQPRVEAQFDGMRDEIAATLDAGQREKWERMYSEAQIGRASCRE